MVAQQPNVTVFFQPAHFVIFLYNNLLDKTFIHVLHVGFKKNKTKQKNTTTIHTFDKWPIFNISKQVIY